MKESHLQPLRSERSASCCWANAAKIGTPGRNHACNLRVRSAALYTLSYGSCVLLKEVRRRQKPDERQRSMGLSTIFQSAIPPSKMGPTGRFAPHEPAITQDQSCKRATAAGLVQTIFRRWISRIWIGTDTIQHELCWYWYSTDDVFNETLASVYFSERQLPGSSPPARFQPARIAVEPALQ